MHSVIKNEINFIENSLNFSIKEIPEKTRFWMVRTKKGYFYDEFIRHKFVALGWNIITKDTDFSNQSIDTLKEQIKNLYGDDRPMGSINKCKRFIDEVQEGDYLLIPNNGSSNIAIAMAGEYYEDKEKSYELEKLAIGKIENHECQITEISCPYRKRRKITIIKIIETNIASYNLRKAISTYHGISDFVLYAEDILNCIYDCYSYRGNVLFAVNITKPDPIRPREISQLMYGLTEFFCNIVEEEILSTTINLNSPGSVRIKLKNGAKRLTKIKMPLVFAFIAVTGGSAFGFELPGVIGTIKDARTLAIEVEKAEIELERDKVALDKEKLENAKTYIELMDSMENQGIDKEKIAAQLNLLYDLSGTLQFEAQNVVVDTEQNIEKSDEN